MAVVCWGRAVRSVTHEDLTDEQLLGLIVEQQREALETFYRRYAGPVYSLAMQMLRDSGAAEEVTQALRSHPIGQGRARIDPTFRAVGEQLHRVVRHAAILPPQRPKGVTP